jgi:replicative DNA helicase
MYAEQLPPHDIDAEEAVIGSLLIDGESINRIATLVSPGDFYRDRNRWCYDACQALYQRGDAINQLTVSHELGLGNHFDDIGGPAYLSHLVAMVPTSVHAEHYARIVNRTATMRRLIDAAGDIATIGYAGSADVDQAITQAEDAIFKVRGTSAVRDFVTIRQVLDEYLEETSGASTSTRTVGPINSGFRDLDSMLGGLQRGDLMIIAARPSLGKSTLAMNIARNATQQGAVAAVFTMEMSRDQIALRLLCAEAEVVSHRLRIGLLTDAESARVMESIGELSDLSIYMDDSAVQTVPQMRSKLRRLHTDRGVDLVVVDYLQLMSGSGARGENRVTELGEITRSLKAVARDLNVPVIAISQLSRAIEQRPDHYPMLSDLRESGSIEQDADVVAFIHREDKYTNQEQWEQRNPTKPFPENLAQIVIAKNRHGPTSTVELYFRGHFFRFEDFATAESTVGWE